MKIRLLRDGISVGNRIHASGDVVEMESTRAVRLVEHGEASFDDPQYTKAHMLLKDLRDSTMGPAVLRLAAALSGKP